jgi:hypothetical protein
MKNNVDFQVKTAPICPKNQRQINLEFFEITSVAAVDS